MTCFDPALFPQEEAEDFAARIFSGLRPQAGASRCANYAVRPAAAPSTKIPPEDARQIQEHVILLYRRFLSERENAKNWDEPLLNFLRAMPRKN
jgi:hypothetical protein